MYIIDTFWAFFYLFSCAEKKKVVKTRLTDPGRETHGPCQNKHGASKAEHMSAKSTKGTPNSLRGGDKAD